MDWLVWLGILAAAVALVVSGRKKMPGVGIVVATVIALVFVWNRDGGLEDIGFSAPENWWVTVVAAVVLGTLIQLVTVMLLEPLVDARLGETHDHSIVDSVKESWLAFVQWLIVVWGVVALLEEIIYRGFLLGQITDLLGNSGGADVIAIVASSIVFGLSHSYQGRSGAITTGVVGAVLGVIFVAAGKNLWLPILTHGVIDTIGLWLIARDKVEALQRPMATRLHR